ncbi:MAG: STAS domain-containing protein [Myxococcales bacterium]|nr:STAS domain-containing protein [Myxococcales bacterium]
MSEESVSVIRVRDVLLVTVPAEPSDASIGALQEQVLAAMEKYRARGLILDIAMVETMDSFFARTLTETAHMVALMGGPTFITGMRPSIAITATELGLELGNAHTALNVDRALEKLDEQASQHE